MNLTDIIFKRVVNIKSRIIVFKLNLQSMELQGKEKLAVIFVHVKMIIILIINLIAGAVVIDRSDKMKFEEKSVIDKYP